MTVLGILGWVGIAIAAVAPAADGLTPLRVILEAPSGCGDAEAFYVSVLSRTDRARRADTNESAVRLEVRLTRAAGKVHGELRLVDDEGKSDLRRVDGASCDEVAEALSLTAALALVSSPRPSARPASSSPSAPVASPPSPAAPAPPTRAAPPAVSPPPAAAAVLTVAERPTESAAPAATVEAKVVSESTTASAELKPGAFRFQLGLGPAVGRILSPGLSVGGAFSSRLARVAETGLAPSVGLAVLHLRNDVLLPSRDVAFSWTAVAVSACPGWGFQGSVVVEACALGLAGWLMVAEQAVSVRHDVSRSWFGVGVALRATAALGGGFEVQADAALHIPVTGRRFTTNSPDETVAESTSVAGMLGVSLVHPL